MKAYLPVIDGHAGETFLQVEIEENLNYLVEYLFEDYNR